MKIWDPKIMALIGISPNKTERHMHKSHHRNNKYKKAR